MFLYHELCEGCIFSFQKGNFAKIKNLNTRKLKFYALIYRPIYNFLKIIICLYNKCKSMIQ